MRKVIKQPSEADACFVEEADSGRIYVLHWPCRSCVYRLSQAGRWGLFVWVDVETSYKTWAVNGHASFRIALDTALQANDGEVLEFENIAEYGHWLAKTFR